jgi:hypothetical protein
MGNGSMRKEQCSVVFSRRSGIVRSGQMQLFSGPPEIFSEEGYLLLEPSRVLRGLFPYFLSVGAL